MVAPPAAPGSPRRLVQRRFEQIVGMVSPIPASSSAGATPFGSWEDAVAAAAGDSSSGTFVAEFSPRGAPSPGRWAPPATWPGAGAWRGGPCADPFLGATKSLLPSSDEQLQRLVGDLPTAFTLFCVMLFATPLWMVRHLALDATAGRWLYSEQLLMLVWLLPAVLGVVHVLHAIRGSPMKSLVTACVVGASVALAVAAELVIQDASHLYGVLSTEDCALQPRSQALQEARDEAVKLYETCKENSFFGQVRIIDCDGYAALDAAEGGALTYLAAVEDRHRCAGWCAAAAALWASGPTEGPCAAAAAGYLQGPVRSAALQVLAYSLVVLCVAVPLLLTAPLRSAARPLA